MTTEDEFEYVDMTIFQNDVLDDKNPDDELMEEFDKNCEDDEE